MEDHFPKKLDKRFSNEKLKALMTMTVVGTTNLVDIAKWLSLIEKYFRVINCPEKRKVKLATSCYKTMLKIGGPSTWQEKAE